MYFLEPYLPTIWLCIIAFFLLYYAVADGFDLGVGMLSLLAPDEKERTIMMATMESIWHDNETWLLLLGGMLFGAFPTFYGIVMSSLYIPVLIMLLGLILRGAAIEFRDQSERKTFWGVTFGLGSLITSLAQGFALGGLIGGIEVKDGQFMGGVWSWFSPFSMLTAFGVLCGYTMLGANYLILRTEGNLQKKSYAAAFKASCLTLIVAVAVHIWSAMVHPHLFKRWSQNPEAIFMTMLLILTVVSFAMYFHSLLKRYERSPLVWNVAIILSSFTAISIGLYPQMIPPILSSAPVTVHAAAASPKTLMFMLGATALLLPVILVYTSYKHRVFRGKVTEKTHAAYSG